MESSHKGMELQHAQEELAKAKKESALMGAVVLQAQHELIARKLLTEQLAEKLTEAVETAAKAEMRVTKIEHASMLAAEDWQADLHTMITQHDAEIRSLRGTKDAYENLKAEFAAAMVEKEEAVRLAREAREREKEQLSAELEETKTYLSTASERASELSSKLALAEGALAEANASFEGAVREGALMVAMKEAELRREVETSRELRCEAERHKKEVFRKELEAYKMSVLVEGLEWQLAESKARELHHTRAASLISSAQEELERTLQKWSRASDEVASLTTALHSIESKLEGLHAQLSELRMREPVQWARDGTSMKAEEALLFLRKALELAQCDAEKAQKDLPVAIDTLQTAEGMVNMTEAGPGAGGEREDAAAIEAEALKASVQSLTCSLHAARMQIEALQLTERDAQRDKAAMEAGVQRLADSGEQLLKVWDTGSDMITLSASPSLPREQDESLTLASPPRAPGLEELPQQHSTTKKKKSPLCLRVGTYLSRGQTSKPPSTSIH